MTNPTNKNFKVYQASAGAGKTYTIVKEYLKLCLQNEKSTSVFSHILAITFTNMAANEMKEKIVKQLVKIIKSDPNAKPKDMEADLIKELGISREELKKNAQLLFLNIIYDYSDFFICTIDAFVQKLARSFAKDLELPTQFNVSIDEEEVADDITERIGEQLGSVNKYLTQIVKDFAENKMEDEKAPKVSNEIHDFTKKLFSEVALDDSDNNPFKDPKRYEETRKHIDGKIYPFEARCAQLVEDFNAFITRNALLPDHFNGKSRSACLSLIKNLEKEDYPIPTATLKNIVEEQTKWYNEKELKAERGKAAVETLEQAFKNELLDHLKFYVDGIGAYLFYKSQQNKLSLYVLRSWLKSEMKKYIDEEQVVHISEFNKRINKILGDFSVPFIYERLGARIKHLFIDEFQDTSVLQWQNLLPLLHNAVSSGSMSMVVGDGKQSIYRWRNGEVEQITSLPKIYGMPENNDTFKDFEQCLIDNFFFDQLETNFRSFSNIITFNNDFFEASLVSLDPKWQKVYFEKKNEFGKEVKIKQLIKHNEPGYVQIELFDPDNEADNAMLKRTKELIIDLESKGFAKSDITILVRKNRHGSMIAEYLAKEGIPVISADSILLKSSPKVRLIISTLDYMIHPDNPVSQASMNYYWNLIQCGRLDGIADGFFDHGPDTEAFKALMIRSYSLYDLCAALMRLYGFDSTGDTYLNYLLDVVFQWQSADEAGIRDFLEYWEKKKNKLTVASGKTDAVTVMTIHKSKGLEFEAVICPFVLDNLDDKKPSTFWCTPEELGFKEPIPNIDKVQFTLTNDSAQWTDETREIAETENAKVRLDNMNLNYVAFTRAKQRLHILSYKTKGKITDKNPINKFLEKHPYHYGDPDTCMVPPEEDEDKETILEFFQESKSSEWINKISVDQNPSMFWADPKNKMKPQEWGDFVHQVLSEIRSTSDIDRALRPHLDAGEIDKDTADMLKGLFLEMASHPMIGKAFSPQAKVKNECDILLSKGEVRRPDRYAELPDIIYLLDYKTGKKSDTYNDQLLLYITELQKMVDKSISAYIVYLNNKVEVVPVINKDIQLTINF